MDRAVSNGEDFLPRDTLAVLLQRLRGEGYRVVGPQVLQGTILYRELEETAQLPWGWRDDQQPGSYRLRQEGERAFAWANGPQGIKPFAFAPQESLWRVEQGMNFQELLPQGEKLALIGVRACDLAALALQDKHFIQGTEVDAHYARRREGVLIIAVNCTHPAETCFCAATGDGPNAESGYDLLLDELDEPRPVFAPPPATDRMPNRATTCCWMSWMMALSSAPVARWGRLYSLCYRCRPPPLHSSSN
jgi:hypothetical protein